MRSKADFVRSLPNASPADVISKAKAAGLSLSLTYVYFVRRADAAKPKNGAAKPKQNGAAKPSALPRGGRNAEEILRAVATVIGVSRALEILTTERDRLRRVLR